MAPASLPSFMALVHNYCAVWGGNPVPEWEQILMESREPRHHPHRRADRQANHRKRVRKAVAPQAGRRNEGEEPSERSEVVPAVDRLLPAVVLLARARGNGKKANLLQKRPLPTLERLVLQLQLISLLHLNQRWLSKIQRQRKQKNEFLQSLQSCKKSSPKSSERRLVSTECVSLGCTNSHLP
eukprot:g33314.t1